MTKQLEALIASIKDTIDDAILNYGESWDSALVQVGANTAVHAICSDAIGGEIVVYAADGSHESSWLCDYLESVSPENVKALIAALEQANCERNKAYRQASAARIAFDEQYQLRDTAEKRIAELEASPLAVKLPAVKKGEVLVTVAGFTGCGKSAVAGEIEIALRAIGLPVNFSNGNAEKRMTGADWLTALEMYKPTVRIVEVNVPRAAGGTVEGE